MIKNTYALYIDGINRTANLILPVKSSLLLDESLDEGVVTLRYVKREVFLPGTPVEIRITSDRMWQGRLINRQTDVLHYVIAGDAADEMPPGSGLYNHEITLVEPTKMAELIVCDTQTVTNDIGRVYTNNAYEAPSSIDNSSNDYGWNGWDDY